MTLRPFVYLFLGAFIIIWAGFSLQPSAIVMAIEACACAELVLECGVRVMERLPEGGRLQSLSKAGRRDGPAPRNKSNPTIRRWRREEGKACDKNGGHPTQIGPRKNLIVSCPSRFGENVENAHPPKERQTI